MELKLPHIDSKRGGFLKDVNMKVKKVRSSTINQLVIKPK